MYYLGVDLGGTNIKAALVSENGEIVKEPPPPPTCPARRRRSVTILPRCVCSSARGEPVAGIGVGCPGTGV